MYLNSLKPARGSTKAAKRVEGAAKEVGRIVSGHGRSP